MLGVNDLTWLRRTPVSVSRLGGAIRRARCVPPTPTPMSSSGQLPQGWEPGAAEFNGGLRGAGAVAERAGLPGRRCRLRPPRRGHGHLRLLSPERHRRGQDRGLFRRLTGNSRCRHPLPAAAAGCGQRPAPAGGAHGTARGWAGRPVLGATAGCHRGVHLVARFHPGRALAATAPPSARNVDLPQCLDRLPQLRVPTAVSEGDRCRAGPLLEHGERRPLASRRLRTCREPWRSPRKRHVGVGRGVRLPRDLVADR